MAPVWATNQSQFGVVRESVLAVNENPEGEVAKRNGENQNKPIPNPPVPH